MRIRLDQITFDAGTQIRAAIDQQVVTDYAEAMTNGEAFPAIVLFHDGNQHYLADGFHRFMAAQRLGFVDFDADVQPGTKDDALWFALGANRKNGKRLTSTDLQHAIRMAFHMWPDKSTRIIAEQVGCTHQWASTVRGELATTCQLPDVTTGKDGKRRPATKAAREADPRRVRIAERLKAGETVHGVAKAEHISTRTVSQIKRDTGVGGPDKSREAVQERIERLRQMAADGYTSRQMAAAVGMTDESCRVTVKRSGIDIPADRAVGKVKHHDSNRIVERTVMDAENLTADVNLIVFGDLDRERLGEWADSLSVSRRALDSFIRRLIKEQQKHGEAA